ncbi:MAG TPA: hypothetical protein VEK39_14520 [Solirubrobacterales bacterium]|nr:hypothetical protein [Solirubrobacterales bacterium]
MRVGAILALIGLMTAAPAAYAADGSRQDATLTFTETKPGTSTGLELHIDYVNPNDPNAKPPAVRTVVTELAAGARFNTAVPELCTASDAELMALGAAGCPAGSVAGEGAVTLDTGLPGPARFIASDATLLNNTDELIFLFTDRQSGERLVTRSQVGERTVVSEVPFLPGTPPDGAALDTVELTGFAISSESGNYLTTPQECPADDRYWINRVHFTYFDSVTQVVETRSPCDPPGAAGPPSCRGRAATIVASPGAATTGTPGDDVIVGSPGRDAVDSGPGDDLLCGRGGRDALVGSDGDDVVHGGIGADRIRGGPGDDRCVGGRGRDRATGCEL